ncbi:unnamed protein product [Acanthoscelides obtectus]|uniref:Uncharacterized protein n=1 Tax=Acanthoscelides obtectus TaxID=200917 RepID=A0A9P0NRJ2_ACAOB|nr:unnamed protein product [Acanthoscelides obtectus]CAK1665619.1 Putative methyltransferase C9orf114 homolog [Acanthoscelides obtectus]
MPPTKGENLKKKTWSEVNKARKEERKKWKEQNLLRKIEKEKKKIAEKSEKKETKISVDNSFADDVPIFISTLSIAVPGSILENAQSLELRTYLAGQIARAACIFQADEIVIFDDYGDEASAKKSSLENEDGVTVARHSCVRFGRILQYLECPQYLRKHFFPIHNDLKFCGILSPLNAPHHLGPNEKFTFREGVVSKKPAKNGAYVYVGLNKDVLVDKSLVPGLRCTVKIFLEQETKTKHKGVIVPPSTPRKETGVYWGYSVRIATSLSKVFSQCPYKEGYDLTIGTSDKGTPVDDFSSPKYRHALVMFGGLQGLEAALENDQILDTDDPRNLYDFYLNMCPNQGSKTIRTEEAVLISLAALRLKLNPVSRPIDFAGIPEETDKAEVMMKDSSCEDDDIEDMSRFD